MHHSIPFFGSVVNVIIIIAILKFVMNAVKKSQAASKKENQDHFENSSEKEIKSSVAPPQNKAPQQQNLNRIKITSVKPQTSNLKYENKPTDRDKLQLKRCTNCGGEIPLSMMKCTICGTRQAGCSWIFIVVVMFIAMFIAMIVAKDSGFPIISYLQQMLGL